MLLIVKVKPNAKETRVSGWLNNDTVCINIKETATDGKANRALIKFLSKSLKIPQSHIELIRGQSNKIKHLNLPDDANLLKLK